MALGHDLSADERVTLQTIFWSAGASRHALAERLGFSKSKTNNTVASLLDCGLLDEVGLQGSSGGRRAETVKLNSSLGVIFGADLGATSLDLALMLPDLTVLAQHSEAADVRSGPGMVLARVRALMRQPGLRGSQWGDFPRRRGPGQPQWGRGGQPHHPVGGYPDRQDAGLGGEFFQPLARHHGGRGDPHWPPVPGLGTPKRVPAFTGAFHPASGHPDHAAGRAGGRGRCGCAGDAGNASIFTWVWPPRFVPAMRGCRWMPWWRTTPGCKTVRGVCTSLKKFWNRRAVRPSGRICKAHKMKLSNPWRWGLAGFDLTRMAPEVTARMDAVWQGYKPTQNRRLSSTHARAVSVVPSNSGVAPRGAAR